MRNSLIVLALCLGASPALAHVSLAEPSAARGSRHVAQFRVGHGCAGKPTTALTVAIPPGVGAVTPEAPPGWSFAVVRVGNRTAAVTWKGGSLPADKAGSFAVTMVLPDSGTQLVFPVTQVCGNAREEWNETPAAGVKRPAPLLLLTAGAAPPSAVTVTDPWFRALPGTLPAGGYFVLRNRGTAKAVLTGAQSTACGALMMHKSESKGGMAAMDMVGAVDVPAGGRLAFAPGGYHLMCVSPVSALKPGGQVPVTLTFQDGAKVTAQFAVRDATGK